MSDRSETDILAREIEAYLSTHPHAADTEEGILNWWLVTQRNQRNFEEIREALDLLVAQGSVVKRVLSNGRFIYARADR